MSIIKRVILAVVVAVVVTLACILLGAILVSMNISIATTVGVFLQNYSYVLGVLCGLWWGIRGSLV